MATQKEMIEKILDQQTAQASHCENCRAKVEVHDTVLNGNGKLGLKAKVSILFWVLGLVGSAATIALAGVLKSAVGL